MVQDADPSPSAWDLQSPELLWCCGPAAAGWDAFEKHANDSMQKNMHLDAFRYYVYHCVSGLRSDEKDKGWKWLIAIIPGWWFGTCFMTFHILGIFIPTDFHIFFRGVGQPPTSHCLQSRWIIECHRAGAAWTSPGAQYGWMSEGNEGNEL